MQMQIFPISIKEQDSMVPWTATSDCWGFISKNQDRLIDVDIDDFGIIGWNLPQEYIVNNKLYHPTRILIEPHPFSGRIIVVAYEVPYPSDTYQGDETEMDIRTDSSMLKNKPPVILYQNNKD